MTDSKTALENNIDEYEEIAEEQEDPELRSVLQSSITTTDWTVETLVTQLGKGNIELSPQFQRRFAWRGAVAFRCQST